MSARPPDFLVVVLDCVRASDFPTGENGADGMPFLASLRPESVVYPKAVSPASWTVPSHSSLFTGQYPWESGVHAKGTLFLPAGVPTLPTMLRPMGYDSVAISGNPVLDRTFGLVESFDTSYWANWWEPFLRFPHHGKPNGSERPEQPSLMSRLPQLRKFLLKGSPYLHRYPFLMDASTRVGGRLRNPELGRSLSVAPWIEDTLAQRVRACPPDRSLFAFVNLIDAHEPYYTDPSTIHGLREWLRYARVRQDHFGYAVGDWHADEHELEFLRGLYRHMIRLMDRRLAALVRAFRDVGRWENTCLVVTSDHGQAFGEHGVLFHTLRIDEQEVRIPLWVRYPNGEHGGKRATGWASLVDVAPTALELAGGSGAGFPAAVPLPTLIDRPRPGPVYAIGDGLIWPHMEGRITGPVRERLDRVYLAGYEGDYKLVYDVRAEKVALYRTADPPADSADVYATDRASATSLEGSVREVGQRLSGAQPVAQPSDVEERLRSWGYI